MQGDWWSSSNYNSPRDNSGPSTNQSAWESSGTTPSVVTLPVHPLPENSPQASGYRSCTGASPSVATGHHHHRHALCNQNTFGVASSASNLILAAQRRKRLYMNQQKATSYLQSSKKLGFGSQSDIVEPDLTWTSFFEHRRTKCSSNSTFSGQDVIQGIPPGTSSTTAATSTTTTTTNGHSSDGSHQMSSDDLKHFERKLEREREKRIHTDPPPNTSRVESRVLSDNIPQFDFNMRRSGFRPANKNSFMTRGEQSMHLAAFRHAHHPTPQELSITSSGAPVAPSASTGGGGVSGALRGQSIGFGSREGGSSGVGGGGGGLNMGSQGRGGASKTRSRALLLAGQSDKYKQTQYQFPDPASGATPDFQQRLNEITALESDTIRYERTKKAKKKSKQDSG